MYEFTMLNLYALYCDQSNAFDGYGDVDCSFPRSIFESFYFIMTIMSIVGAILNGMIELSIFRVQAKPSGKK